MAIAFKINAVLLQLHVKAEFNDVPVGHYIFFAFHADFAL
jgi:hypothetical protein